jgi:lactate dehydrogenase-like 2-hydroxyacid dehydrogenase
MGHLQEALCLHTAVKNPMTCKGRLWNWLQGFGCKEVLYFDYKHLDESKEKELCCSFAEFDELIKKCDVVTINLPLTDKTK